MPILFTPSPATTFHPSQLGAYPQIIVEAAFEPGGPGIGPFDLRLGDATFGLLNHDVLADDDVWAEITSYVQDGTVTRQSTRQQGPLTVYQGGTATFTLNNSDGRFDPGNLAGPYVSAGITQVRPMVPIRVRAIFDGVTYGLFSGFAIAWTPPAQNFGPVYDQTVLTCADAFRVLTGVILPTLTVPAGAGEDTGTRVDRILAAAGWYSTARGKSVIYDGDSTLQATTFGTDALSLAQLAADSEAGELYVDGAGRVVFRNRRAIISDARSVTVQGVFGGVPGTFHGSSGDIYSDIYSDSYGVGVTEYEATLLTRPDDDTTMANDIQATITGSSNMQEASDLDSKSRFLFFRTYSRADLILQTDADANQWANWILSLAADDEFRFDEVTITPGVDPGDLFPQALGRELGDRIQVTKRPPGVAPYTKDLFVRGIEHTFTPTWWQTKWTTQNAARYSFFVLNDSTLGVLNTDALAW